MPKRKMEDVIKYLSNSAEEEDGDVIVYLLNSAEEEDGRGDRVSF